MIFVVFRLDVRPEKREEFRTGIVRYSGQVRDEPGKHGLHLPSGSFGWLGSVVTEVLRIVYRELPGEGWSPMGEVTLDRS